MSFGAGFDAKLRAAAGEVFVQQRNVLFITETCLV